MSIAPSVAGWYRPTLIGELFAPKSRTAWYAALKNCGEKIYNTVQGKNAKDPVDEYPFPSLEDVPQKEQA